MEKQYKIKWRLVLTDATGEITATFNEKESDQLVNALNQKNKGIEEFWKEEVKQPTKGEL